MTALQLVVAKSPKIWNINSRYLGAGTLLLPSQFPTVWKISWRHFPLILLAIILVKIRLPYESIASQKGRVALYNFSLYVYSELMT
ncbi:MAG: hypothetical protein CMQ14_10665 [Gammaproteobacteria bacterium]|nr:hypothetical protein [Gammaproteobacteria bacterium]